MFQDHGYKGENDRNEQQQAREPLRGPNGEAIDKTEAFLDYLGDKNQLSDLRTPSDNPLSPNYVDPQFRYIPDPAADPHEGGGYLDMKHFTSAATIAQNLPSFLGPVVRSHIAEGLGAAKEAEQFVRDRIDDLTGGRTDLGNGSGWHHSDFESNQAGAEFGARYGEDPRPMQQKMAEFLEQRAEGGHPNEVDQFFGGHPGRAIDAATEAPWNLVEAGQAAAQGDWSTAGVQTQNFFGNVGEAISETFQTPFAGLDNTVLAAQQTVLDGAQAISDEADEHIAQPLQDFFHEVSDQAQQFGDAAGQWADNIDLNQLQESAGEAVDNFIVAPLENFFGGEAPPDDPEANEAQSGLGGLVDGAAEMVSDWFTGGDEQPDAAPADPDDAQVADLDPDGIEDGQSLEDGFSGAYDEAETETWSEEPILDDEQNNQSWSADQEADAQIDEWSEEPAMDLIAEEPLGADGPPEDEGEVPVE